MSSPVSVPYELYEKLVKRVTRLRFPPHPDYTPEQVERHFHLLEFGSFHQPEEFINEIHEVLDMLEKPDAPQTV